MLLGVAEALVAAVGEGLELVEAADGFALPEGLVAVELELGELELGEGRAEVDVVVGIAAGVVPVAVDFASPAFVHDQEANTVFSACSLSFEVAFALVSATVKS